MNIEEIRKQIEQSQNEIVHLNDEIRNLNQARDNMTEETYNSELEKINHYIENAQKSLEENQRLNRAYDNMLRNIKRLNILDDYAREETYRKNLEEIAEERERLEEEIKSSRKVLPEELQEEIRNIVLNDINKNQNSNSRPKNPTQQQNPKQTNNQQKPNLDIYDLDENGNIRFFDGTAIAKPRNRKPDETDQEYINFLADYYDNLSKLGVFSPKRVEDKNPTKENPNEPNLRQNNENIPRLPKPREDDKNIPRLPKPKEDEKDIPRLPKPKEDEKEIPRLPKPKEDEKEIPRLPKKDWTLQEIMQDLTKDLYIQKKAGERYEASNISVTKNFKRELSEKEKLYNITQFFSSLKKAPIATIKKYWSKWRNKVNDQEDTMKILKERIDNLDEDRLMVIWNEYKGGQVLQDRFPTALNILLNDRMQRFANEKVGKINLEIAKGYQKVFNDYQVIQTIDKELSKKGLKEEDRIILQAQKDNLLSGKAELIGKIRENYKEGNKWYSGGSHGFSEDMKASRTKMSLPGKRFAKSYDWDDYAQELQSKKATLERQEVDAVKAHDDENALKNFIDYEVLKSNETKVKEGFWGPKAEGRMQYSPLVGELDYRDDPFIRNVFVTTSSILGSIAIGNAIYTHNIKADQILDQQQDHANKVNAANQQTIDQIHQTGRDIAGKRDVFNQGMQAQANSDSINTLNIGERNASNLSVNAGHGWTGSDIYRSADNIAHETAKNSFEAAQQQIEDITAKYSVGDLSQSDVTAAFADMATKANNTLTSTIKNAESSFNTYMQSHPQFELSEVGNAMNYLVQNPQAIPDMYKAMADVTDMGDTLAGLSIEQVQALQSLPSDLQTTLLGAAGTAALAYQCAKATQTYNNNNSYENDITKMVSEYASKQQAQEQANTKAA